MSEEQPLLPKPKRSKRCGAVTLSVFYAIGSGASNGLSLLGSFFKRKVPVPLASGALLIARMATTTESEYQLMNPPLAITLSVVSLAVNLFTAYNFQGTSIRKGIVGKIDEDNFQGGKKYPRSSKALQILYLLSRLVNRISDRYLLFSTLYNLFGRDIYSPEVLVLFPAGVVINFLFSATNEVGEPCEVIAKRLEGKLAPCYSPFFKGLKVSPLRTTLKVLGTADHVIMDDVLPGLALMTPKIIEVLKKNPWSIGLISAPGSLLVSLLLLQTYLFEGAHTDKSVKRWFPEINDSQSDIGSFQSPKWIKLLKFLKGALNLMGPVHGLADAAPVWLALRLFELHWGVCLAASGVVFLSTTTGIHSSEVREAKRACDKYIKWINNFLIGSQHDEDDVERRRPINNSQVIYMEAPILLNSPSRWRCTIL